MQIFLPAARLILSPAVFVGSVYRHILSAVLPEQRHWIVAKSLMCPSSFYIEDLGQDFGEARPADHLFLKAPGLF